MGEGVSLEVGQKVIENLVTHLKGKLLELVEVGLIISVILILRFD
jgi:hypothetical protein